MTRIFETMAEGGVIHLPLDVPSPAHCVVTVLDVDVDTLRKQAEFELPDATQRRMAELLQKNREGTLPAVELAELDALVEEFDAATLGKGQALVALSRLNGKSHPG
jgi:hypothetical protein